MNQQTRDVVQKRLENLDKMPTLPVSLLPLLHYMEQPLDKLEVHEVVNLISQDKSLVAQCLHMANSPLFGRWQEVRGIREAVVALGLQRMRDIATSCSILKLLPKEQTGVDPVVFWEHSLGVALVCRQFARKIGYHDPGKAYLGGLLHDIGIVVHLWIIPDEFKQAVELARAEHVPLHEAEVRAFGLSHSETGMMIAERWHLAPDIAEVVRAHHDPSTATVHRDLVAVVALSDLLCRMGGLGHGSVEDRQIDFMEEPGVQTLLKECPSLSTFDWARFTFELEGYLEEVHRLVQLMYRPS